MNGELDCPFLQTLRLNVPRASIAPPNSIPVVTLAEFLENRNPRRPTPNTKPPVAEKGQ